MSLGTGALQVVGGPWALQAQQGGIHGNPASGNCPCMQPPPGTVTLTRDQWKNTYHTLILPKPQNHEGGRAGSKNPQWFAEIEKQMIGTDQLKTKRKHATRRAASS